MLVSVEKVLKDGEKMILKLLPQDAERVVKRYPKKYFYVDAPAAPKGKPKREPKE